MERVCFNSFRKLRKIFRIIIVYMESFSRNHNKTEMTTFIKKGAQMDKWTLINIECPHIEFC